MKIYIDGDGCPVVRNTLKIAHEFDISCVILCDTAHRIVHDGVETIVVEKGADSVDFRLVNLIQKGDIAVTQDYGLAAMCLSRQAIVLNQDGKIYTDENIDGLLAFRAISKIIRQSGGRTRGKPKRTSAQDDAFEVTLRRLLQSAVKE